MILFVVSGLFLSSIVMGNLAFRAGLGVKRWAFVGLLFGPFGYPLLSTHKRFAWKKAQGRGNVNIIL